MLPLRQKPRRVPHRSGPGRHHEAGVVEEVHGLCGHAGGKQGDEPAGDGEDVAARNRQQTEIGQGR